MTAFLFLAAFLDRPWVCHPRESSPAVCSHYRRAGGKGKRSLVTVDGGRALGRSHSDVGSQRWTPPSRGGYMGSGSGMYPVPFSALNEVGRREGSQGWELVERLFGAGDMHLDADLACWSLARGPSSPQKWGKRLVKPTVVDLSKLPWADQVVHSRARWSWPKRR